MCCLLGPSFLVAGHGVSVKVTVALPVVAPCGLIKTVYVPVTGSVSGPSDPVALHVLLEPSELPSGFKMEVVTAKHPVYVELARLTLADCPDVPLKVYLAFWPGILVLTVKGVPGVIVPVTSLNELKRTVALPVAVPPGSMTTV